MNLNLNNRVAVITGASSGLGKAIAKTLLEEGCDIAISSSNYDNIEATKKELTDLNLGKVFSDVCDVNYPDQIKSFLHSVNDVYGKIDIIISNTGGPKPTSFIDSTPNDWQETINLVLMSCITLFQEGIKYVKESEQGRLIAITSIGAKQPAQDLVLSNSTRAAIHSIIKTFSREVAKYNVTVNAISPGSILTNRQIETSKGIAMEKGISVDEVLKERKNLVPLKRFGKPEEASSAVTYLCSRQAGFITGTSLSIDGGLSNALP